MNFIIALTILVIIGYGAYRWSKPVHRSVDDIMTKFHDTIQHLEDHAEHLYDKVTDKKADIEYLKAEVAEHEAEIEKALNVKDKLRDLVG